MPRKMRDNPETQPRAFALLIEALGVAEMEDFAGDGGTTVRTNS